MLWVLGALQLYQLPASVVDELLEYPPFHLIVEVDVSPITSTVTASAFVAVASADEILAGAWSTWPRLKTRELLSISNLINVYDIHAVSDVIHRNPYGMFCEALNYYNMVQENASKKV